MELRIIDSIQSQFAEWGKGYGIIRWKSGTFNIDPTSHTIYNIRPETKCTLTDYLNIIEICHATSVFTIRLKMGEQIGKLTKYRIEWT